MDERVVFELVECMIEPGSESAFEAAYAEGRQLLLRAKGCISVRLLRGVEEPTKYRLIVQWQTLENHTNDFRGSADHQHLREITGRYVVGSSLVQHYHAVF